MDNTENKNDAEMTSTLTEEQIFAKADELNAAGKKVSSYALQKALGRGSYTTLGRSLEKWRQQRATSVPALAPSTALMIAIHTEIQTIVERKQAEFEAVNASHLQTQEEMAALADELQTKLEGLAGDLEIGDKEKTDLSRQLIEALSDLTEAREKLQNEFTQAERVRTALALLEQRATALEAQNEDQTLTIALHELEVSELKQKRDDAQSELQSAHASQSKLREDLMAARLGQQEAQRQVEKAGDRESKLQAELLNAQLQQADAQRQADRARDELSLAREAEQRARQQAEKALQATHEAERMLAEVQGRLAATELPQKSAALHG